MAIEVGEVVEPDVKSDLGDRAIAVAHKQAAGKIDAQPRKIADWRHAGMPAEGPRKSRVIYQCFLCGTWSGPLGADMGGLNI